MHVTVLLGAACTHMVGPDHSKLGPLHFMLTVRLDRSVLHSHGNWKKETHA